jgi:hypothetical protein
MSCPECDRTNEKPDPRSVFRTLCPEHLARVVPLSEEVIQKAFEEGLRARQAMIDAFVPPQVPSGLRFR